VPDNQCLGKREVGKEDSQRHDNDNKALQARCLQDHAIFANAVIIGFARLPLIAPARQNVWCSAWHGAGGEWGSRQDVPQGLSTVSGVVGQGRAHYQDLPPSNSLPSLPMVARDLDWLSSFRHPMLPHAIHWLYPPAHYQWNVHGSSAWMQCISKPRAGCGAWHGNHSHDGCVDLWQSTTPYPYPFCGGIGSTAPQF